MAMEIAPRRHTARTVTWTIGLAIGGFALLYSISLTNNLFFHVLAEFFSILVCYSIFTFTWHSRRYLEDNFLVFLGLAHLFVGSMDTLHTFAFQGLNIFHTTGGNLSVQLWIAGRFIMAAGWLGAAWLIGRRVRPARVLLGFALVFIGLLYSIFWWRNFPVCYVEPIGLTQFKIMAEYGVSFAVLAALIIFTLRRYELDRLLYRLLAGAMVITILSEMSFTLYVDVYGFFVFLGHYLKIAASFVIYMAIIERGMTHPFTVLFRNLQRSREELSRERELLEQRVQERTEELRANQERLRSLASELSLAEERERRRIATEIHDNLSQTLAFAKMQLDALQRKPEVEAAGAELAQLRQALDSALADSRSATFELSPPILYTMGLEAAVEWLGRQAQERHEIAFHFENDDQPKPLRDDIRTILFQAVREIFNNMGKHARAQNAWARLRVEAEMLHIAIEDDGVGFDPATIEWRPDRESGFGLFNMRERLEHFGGRVDVDSAPGHGARFTLVAPLGDAAIA